MLSLFKKNEHKATKPNSLIRSISGTSYGDDVDALPILVTSPKGRAQKSPNTPRSSATDGFDLTTMPISSSSMGSGSSAVYFPLDHQLANSTTDCTALFMQASANGNSNERLLFPTSTDTGTKRESRETSLNVPPSTPFSHGSIYMDKPPTILVSDVEGITYDVILVSTLHKNLGMKYRDIPATRTPPNSPAAIQEGGFGSLMGVSMAIMQGGA